MLPSIEAYSQVVYGFLDTHPTVRRHSIRIYPRSPQIGVLEGRIEFDLGIELRIFERIDFARQRIVAYSYEVWQNQQQLYWYDPMEHPEDADLATTFPHHKHVPPDIKHHRVPAPGLSFASPNLSILIEEIQHTLLGSL